MNAAARPDAAPVRAGTAGAAPSPAGQGSPCGGALCDDLGWGLGVLFRSYAKAATAAFAELPGGPRGYQVLATASQGEPGSQLELAHHLGVDRTVMTYLLDDLEGAGLIERRPDTADRRVRRILVTALGRERLENLGQRLRAAEQHVLAGLATDADRQVFRASLQRLATHANALDPAPSSCTIAAQVT